MRNQRGITLIALVVTIIVLLILAGVSIAMLTGSNGIIDNAVEARNRTDRANAIETINLALQSIKVEAVAQSIDDNTYDPVDNLEALADEAVTGITDTAFVVTPGTDDITISYSNISTGTNVSGSIAFDGSALGGTITGAADVDAGV